MCYPHMHSQIPRVDFTQSHLPFLELWTLDIYSSFWGVIALLPVDFGEVVWNFLLQITERVVLKNENSVAVRMYCEGK